MATLEAWNGRTAAQCDADSPLDSVLIDGIRKDLDHLRQVLYGNSEAGDTYFTPIWGHDHDGANSKAVVAGAALYLDIPENTTTLGVTAYAVFWSGYLYIPLGVKTLNLRIRLKTTLNNVSATAYAYLSVNSGSCTSPEVSTQSTGFVDKDVSVTLDASAKGGYKLIELYLRNSHSSDQTTAHKTYNNGDDSKYYQPSSCFLTA